MLILWFASPFYHSLPENASRSRVPRLNAPMGTPRPHVSRHVSGRAPRRGRRPRRPVFRSPIAGCTRVLLLRLRRPYFFQQRKKYGKERRQKPTVFGFPLSDSNHGTKRFRIESLVRLSPLPLPRTARVACYDRLRYSAIRAAAASMFRAAVPYCVGAGVPDGPLLVPFMPLAGIFRAPARHPFARGGKRMQKRRQRPMVFGIPLRRT